MTDEEKKEFEEFLKWKKEKNNKSENQENDSKDNTCNSKDVSSEIKQMIQENSDNKSAGDVNYKILLFGGIALVFLIFMLIFSLKSQNQRNAQQNQVLVEDSIKEEKEKAVQDSIANAKRANLLKHTVKITSAYLSSPNSAGGCDATLYYKNLSNKTIKYFCWTGYCKNAVGDRVECEIRGDEFFAGRDTGPVRPGKSSGGTWDCIIYNYSAEKLIITDVDITYMDGTHINISQDEMKYIR